MVAEAVSTTSRCVQRNRSSPRWIRQRYDVERILITQEGRWEPRAISPEPGANPGIDVVFPVLHGTFGEDGTVQGLLELAGLALCRRGRARFGGIHGQGGPEAAVHGTRPAGRGLRGACRATIWISRKSAGGCRFPMFVKPANLGSSVGISKAKNCEELKAALELAGDSIARSSSSAASTGREFECAVLGNDDPIAAVPAKFCLRAISTTTKISIFSARRRTVLPADLTPEQTREVQRLAVECYHAVECEGMARVDFLLEAASGKFYINEINTMPGFTSISMYPKMWEAAGLPYAELIDRLIELALERHRERRGDALS